MDPAIRPPPDAPPAEPRAARNWVPVRSLAPRHRERIAAHLLRLADADRNLRFGHAASDAQIQKYVDLLDFDQDEIFGIFNRRLELVAMAHLAFAMGDGTAASTAEFGVSVLADARGRGFGQRLFEHAMLHARNRGVKTLVIFALSENTTMLRIARNLGAEIVREGFESEGRIALPGANLGSQADAIFAESAAEFDYRLKVRGRQFARVLELIGEVRAQIGAHAHPGAS